jgi:hypothetical protein
VGPEPTWKKACGEILNFNWHSESRMTEPLPSGPSYPASGAVAASAGAALATPTWCWTHRQDSGRPRAAADCFRKAARA